jgi:hypothetical protein
VNGSLPWLLAATVALTSACENNESACAMLKSESPDGVTLATDEHRCGELLQFGTYVEQQYHMDFKTWLATVPGQGVGFISDALFALTGDASAPRPTSFAPTPATPPCGPGVEVTDDVWARLPFSRFVKHRPDTLYVSFSVELQTGTPNIATLRAYQDFDCDHKLDVLEVVGEYTPGVPPLAGGWHLLHSSTPAVDE